ncbi:MAG: hypothetical protein AB7F74_19715 [Parvibaculaceae bacterium]
MNRQLPVGTCLWHAVNSVRNNLRHAFRVSWPWLLILVLLGAVVVTIVASAGDDVSVAGFSAILIWILAAMLAGAAIAVHWHRYILLDEVARLGDVLRLDNKTWRYFGNIVLIALIVGGIQTIVMYPIRAVIGGNENVVESVISLILALVCGVISYRLGVKLPAIALDRQDFRFSRAWEATRGNDLKLFFVFLIQLVVTLLIVVGLYLLAIGLTILHPALGVIGFIILLMFLWLLSIFNITILTSLYGFFVENRDF